MINIGNIITINGKRYEAHDFQIPLKINGKTDPTSPCSICSFKDFDCFEKKIDCYSLEHVIYFKEKK